MARRLQQILMVLGIGGISLFQVGGCDTLATAFLDGVQTGYTSVTGTNLFEDIGAELAGGSSYVDEPVDYPTWDVGSPYAYSYSYSGFVPGYW